MTESGTATAERGRNLVKSGGAQNFGHVYETKVSSFIMTKMRKHHSGEKNLQPK